MMIRVNPRFVSTSGVKFDRTGRFAIRPGRLILPEPARSDARNSLLMEFVDDQLLNTLRRSTPRLLRTSKSSN